MYVFKNGCTNLNIRANVKKETPKHVIACVFKKSYYGGREEQGGYLFPHISPTSITTSEAFKVFRRGSEGSVNSSNVGSEGRLISSG